MRLRDLLHTWREKTGWLRQESYALILAYRDQRTPWYAKVFAACVVAYAFSPLDLIPDFVPVLGYLDDLVLVPLGLTLAVRMIPAQVMAESRRQAQQQLTADRPRNWAAAVVIVVVWLLLAALAVVLVARVV